MLDEYLNGDITMLAQARTHPDSCQHIHIEVNEWYSIKHNWFIANSSAASNDVPNLTYTDKGLISCADGGLHNTVHIQCQTEGACTIGHPETDLGCCLSNRSQDAASCINISEEIDIWKYLISIFADTTCCKERLILLVESVYV